MGSDLQRRCLDYLASRTSTYQFRCVRFAAATQKLLLLGMQPHHTLLDLGAGRQDFGTYLIENKYLSPSNYHPVDASIDGTDLNHFKDLTPYDYVVAIEVLEHLLVPDHVIRHVELIAHKGVVFTVPNPSAVDVIGCDPTHVSIITADHFHRFGFTTEEVSLFNLLNDSLIAWRSQVPWYD